MRLARPMVPKIARNFQCSVRVVQRILRFGHVHMLSRRTYLLILSTLFVGFAGGYCAGGGLPATAYWAQLISRTSDTKAAVRTEETVKTLQSARSQSADPRTRSSTGRSAENTGVGQRGPSGSYQNGTASEGLANRSGSDEPHLATVLADPALFGAILETDTDPSKILAWPKQ